MPRSFDIAADLGGSVDDVYRALSEPEYWRARLINSNVNEYELESMRVDDGTIEVATLQVIYSKNLPALVTQLHRGDLRLRRTETWGPVIDGTSTASLTASIAGAPLTLTGTGGLSTTPEGTASVDFLVSVHVRVPIIGGKVEKIVGSQLPTVLEAEQRFTATWIKEHA